MPGHCHHDSDKVSASIFPFLSRVERGVRTETRRKGRSEIRRPSVRTQRYCRSAMAQRDESEGDFTCSLTAFLSPKTAQPPSMPATNESNPRSLPPLTRLWRSISVLYAVTNF